VTVQQRCWLVDGFQKSPVNISRLWSKISKGLPIVTLLLRLPCTKNTKHKGYEITLSCCSPNSRNANSWLSRLGSATCGQRAIKSPWMLHLGVISRLNSGNTCCHSVLKLLPSQLLA